LYLNKNYQKKAVPFFITNDLLRLSRNTREKDPQGIRSFTVIIKSEDIKDIKSFKGNSDLLLTDLKSEENYLLH
jgi:hypothetical protein